MTVIFMLWTLLRIRERDHSPIGGCLERRREAAAPSVSGFLARIAAPGLAIRIGHAMTLPTILWFFKKLLSALLLPPLMPLLLIAVGLLLLPWKARLGRSIAWAGVLTGLLLCTPISVGWLIAPLENVPVLRPEGLARGQAIVILAAGRQQYMPEYGHPTPNRLGLERLRYGARVARKCGLPVLISGGGAPESWAEARLMAEVLSVDFGVRARWIEAGSKDTEENGRLSSALLQAEGIRRIVLVTHAAHMRRAMREFESQGMEVIPAPTGFFWEQESSRDAGDFMPGANAARAGWYAVYEWLALLAQTSRLGLP